MISLFTFILKGGRGLLTKSLVKLQSRYREGTLEKVTRLYLWVPISTTFDTSLSLTEKDNCLVTITISGGGS